MIYVQREHNTLLEAIGMAIKEASHAEEGEIGASRWGVAIRRLLLLLKNDDVHYRMFCSSS